MKSQPCVESLILPNGTTTTKSIHENVAHFVQRCIYLFSLYLLLRGSAKEYIDIIGDRLAGAVDLLHSPIFAATSDAEI